MGEETGNATRSEGSLSENMKQEERYFPSKTLAKLGFPKLFHAINLHNFSRGLYFLLLSNVIISDHNSRLSTLFCILICHWIYNCFQLCINYVFNKQVHLIRVTGYNFWQNDTESWKQPVETSGQCELAPGRMLDLNVPQVLQPWYVLMLLYMVPAQSRSHELLFEVSKKQQICI